MATQRQLKRGDQGEDVKALAERLGYYSSVPGVFDYNLEERVRAFQRSKGLTPDGWVGPKTLAALGGYLLPPQMAYNGRVLFTYNGNGTYRRVRDGATVTYAQAQAQQLDEWRRDPASANPGGVPSTNAGNRGGGSAGVPATVARANFEWVAPAYLSVTTFDWNAAQNRLTAAANSTGFSIQYASWETRVGIQTIYSLVYRGLSPANVTTPDAINNQLTSLAEQVGFSIVRDAVVCKVGQIVATTDDGGGNPKGKNDWIVIGAVVLVGALFAREILFD